MITNLPEALDTMLLSPKLELAELTAFMSRFRNPVQYTTLMSILYSSSAFARSYELFIFTTTVTNATHQATTFLQISKFAE